MINLDTAHSFEFYQQDNSISKKVKFFFKTPELAKEFSNQLAQECGINIVKRGKEENLGIVEEQDKLPYVQLRGDQIQKFFREAFGESSTLSFPNDSMRNNFLEVLQQIAPGEYDCTKSNTIQVTPEQKTALCGPQVEFGRRAGQPMTAQKPMSPQSQRIPSSEMLIQKASTTPEHTATDDDNLIKPRKIEHGRRATNNG